MVRRILLALAVLCLSVQAGWVFSEGGLPGTFMNYGPAPRSLALGKAFTGLADDAQAGYFNPAGLFQLNSHQVLVAHSQLYGARMEFAGYSLPTREMGTFGVSVMNYGAEGIDARDIHNNESADPYAFAENAYIISYAYNPWNFLAFGANLKLITKNLAAYSGVGMGADLGAIVTLPRPFSFGIVGQNLVQPTLQLKNLSETYPRIVRAGGAVRLLDGRAIVTVDAVMPVVFERDSFGNPTADFAARVIPHGGVEFHIVPGILVQRVGFDPNEISLGLGVHSSWGKMGIGVDYAFLLHYLSGYRMAPTHKLGMFVDFAGYRVWVDAGPSVFSPTPDNPQNVLWMDLRINTRSPVKRWQLLIRNSFGEIVRTFQGWESPPLRMSWDGLDDVGRLVGDGRYRYEIVVVDERNRSLEYSGTLTQIRTKGPEGRIEIRPGE